MKIQMAYKFTGEDPEVLMEQLRKIVFILEGFDHEVYCPCFDMDKPTEKKDLFFGTLKKIEGCDAIFALIKFEDKSEGMLMEVGHAWGLDKKLIVAIQDDVHNTHLRGFADQLIEFCDIEDLYGKLEMLK